jgi:probable F420-dependent oxidoreductase
VRSLAARAGRPPAPAGTGGGPAESVRYGFLTTPNANAVRDLAALCPDSLWCGGHVASANPTPEPMIQLARLTALTEGVTIGTAVLTLPLYPPAIVAKQVADLDNLAGGRLVLGVGVGGEYPQEFRACGVDLAHRGARTDEAIRALRKLWTAEEVTVTGRHLALPEVRIHPRPAQSGGPPIVVAGRGDRAMRRAAELGDGWLPYLYSPRRYARSVAAIGDHAAAAGRELTGFRWMAFVFVNARPDRAAARAEAAQCLGLTYRQDFGAIVEHVTATGTLDDVTDTVQRFVDAGVRHLVFAPARREGQLELAAQLTHEVMPRISQRPAKEGNR